VIGLNLCPFAKPVVQQNRVRWKILGTTDLEHLAIEILEEAKLLLNTEVEEVETSLLIAPNALANFYDYWDYTALLEEHMEDLGLIGKIQLATFHPQYQFAGTKEDALENYTNRSPFPIFHLLREDSLFNALESYPDPDQIPLKNIEKMNRLGRPFIEELFAKIQLG